MPNLPYSTSGWTTHSKVARVIDYPLPGNLTDFSVGFTYEGPRSTYSAASLGSTEPEYAGAGTNVYLCRQGPLEPIGGGAIRYNRLWATLPFTQYEPTSMLFSLPDLHDVYSSSRYGVRFVPGRNWLFSTRISVSAIAALASETTITQNPAFPAGFVTCISSNGSGASFALSSTAGTIRAVLNAIGIGAAVVVTRNSIAISTPATGYKLTSVDCAVDGVRVTCTDDDYTLTYELPTSTTAQPSTVRTVTTGSSHGGSAGEWMAAWNGDKLLGACRAVAASGSSITIPATEAPWNMVGLAITHIAFASQAAACIAHGVFDVSARRARRFYLPGVSVGISNLADVPAQTVVTRDPVSWMDAVVSYLAAPSEDTYAVDAVDALTRYLDGPIFEKSCLEIQMQDAVKSVSKTA